MYELETPALLLHLDVVERNVKHMAERAKRLGVRSEEHTSELQSQSNLVCRLLLEKKKKKKSENQATNQKTGEHKNKHITRRQRNHHPSPTERLQRPRRDTKEYKNQSHSSDPTTKA